MAKHMGLNDLLKQYRDGDEIGWQNEFDELWSREPGYMDHLCDSINRCGITIPILLGDDGRVWDGHHRLAAAQMLGLETVPVERVPTSQISETPESE